MLFRKRIQRKNCSDDCSQLVSEADVHLYAAESTHAAQPLDMTATISQVESLKALSAQLPGIYITHAAALAFAVPPREKIHAGDY